jgi:hypothetical protein
LFELTANLDTSRKTRRVGDTRGWYGNNYWIQCISAVTIGYISGNGISSAADVKEIVQACGCNIGGSLGIS